MSDLPSDESEDEPQDQSGAHGGRSNESPPPGTSAAETAAAGRSVGPDGGEVAVDGLAGLDGDGGRLSLVRRRTWAFLGAVAALGATFAYDYWVLGPRESVVLDVDPAGHEWLFALSLLVFGFYGVLPLAARPRLARRYWSRLRAHPPGLASFVYLGVVFVLGLVGPALVGDPVITTAPPYQPPLFVSAPANMLVGCVGPVVDGACRGSLAYPLGTSGNSRDILVVVVHGMRVTVEVALVSAALLVPLGTAVGATAAEFGGRLDDVLMRGVDLVQAVPAFFVYIVAQYVYEPSFTMLLVVFGLLSWGSISRMVRSEAIKRREEGFVRAAEAAGAGRLTVLRRHLVPNVSNTVVTAVTLQIPTLVLVEAALSYLALGDPTVWSFGYSISAATNPTDFPLYWWTSAIPTAFLLSIVVALNVFGDALRDILDPRLRGGS